VNDEELILKAAALSSTRDWAEFLAAFARYTDERMEQCVASPAADLKQAQGRAQDARHLLKLFRECRPQAEKIRALRQSKQR
jgi:hypothetical protein